MISLWEKSADIQSFPSLEKDIKTDILIIGGGMAGVLCAFMLHNIGADYLLIEAKRIGGGITQNTTAKITAQHGLLYERLTRKIGASNTALYLDANIKALEEYRSLCRDIDCSFENVPSFVYSLTKNHALQKEEHALKALGYDVSLVKSLPLPFPIAEAVGFSNQAQFHPLRFLAEISRGLNIYENTKVCELVKNVATTDRAKITANKIIVATHFPFLNKHGSYFLKLYQHRSYVIALKNARPVGGIYIDASKNGLSFRDYGDLLLIGGGGHRTGKKGTAWQELRAFAALHYPMATEVAHWATQDCMTLDGIPYIGKYSANTNGLYVATGFNKWGMTSSMVAARLLCDMMQNRSNPYEALFSPSRSILHPQLAINAFESVSHILTPTVPRCPHLGCALKWNPHEHTWDCPCHGSRFTAEGHLIDNPSTGNLKKSFPKKN